MMLLRLLSQLDRDRFQPVVISLMGSGTLGDRLTALDIPVQTLNLTAGRPSLSSLRKLYRLSRQLAPDLIQGWMYHGNFAAQLASRFAQCPVPVLWNIRQSLYSLKYEKSSTAALIRLEAWLSRFPTRILYNSKTSAQHHERLGYQTERTQVIANGFDTNQFQPNPDAYRRYRQELKISPDTFLIGLVARWHPMKDHANFLQAAAHLIQQNPQLKVHFLLCGLGIDWQNSALVSRIDALGLRSRFHLLGDRPDMPGIQAALDLATSASFTESFPNVLGEAMACAVPCVATAVGDTPWLLGETGWLVPPRDPVALAQAWSVAIAAGAAARQARGHAARARVSEHFSLAAIAAQYASTYKMVVSDNQASMAERH
ncbi:glycosyltransferase [bacterium]|nr:glycosyltransferase [bacterium]